MELLFIEMGVIVGRAVFEGLSEGRLDLRCPRNIQDGGMYESGMSGGDVRAWKCGSCQYVDVM